MGAAEFKNREEIVVNALRVISHTYTVDPVFFQQCVAAASIQGPPGFGSLLEQHEDEFKGLLSHVNGCRSALEIGSRYGKSIQRIASVMERGSKVSQWTCHIPEEQKAYLMQSQS